MVEVGKINKYSRNRLFIKKLFKNVSSEFPRRYNIDFDFENILSDFDKLVAGTEKVVKMK